MASRKKGQRKRKSAGVCDIFEVNEKDLSPEPPNRNEGEPKPKVQKTTLSEPEKSHNSEKSEPENDRLHCDTTDDSVEQVCSFESNNSSIILVEDSLPSQSSFDVINVEDENSDLDPDVVIVNDDKVHILEIIDNETEMANVEHSIITEKVQDVSTNLEDQCEVVSVSQNFINSDLDCTDNTIENKKNITIHSESTNDILEDGEVAEPDTEDSDKPVITIHFRDSSISDLYKLKFMKVLQQFVELNPKENGNVINIFRDEALDPKEWVLLDGTVCINDHSDEEELAKNLPLTPKPNSPKKKKKRKKSQSVTDLFVVDTQPAQTHNMQLPPTKYSAKFSIDDEKEKNKSNKPSFSAMCFNCEQEHSLKDCPFPKNFAKISANRQKHQYKSKSSRYHLEEDQKFSHLQPGKPSAALRKALGLRKHQVPGYVYRMRILGYPPGWLEEAQYVKSDLNMFDIDGNCVRNTSSKKIQGLNPEKVIDYSGFNVPLEKGFKDEYKYYQVPPFSDYFRKENMIDVFNKMVKNQQDDFETLDMDLDNSDLLADVINQSETKRADSAVDSDSNDPTSLLELENQKNSLLEEIKKAGEAVSWVSSDSKDTLTESNAITLDNCPDNAVLETSQTDDSKTSEETKPTESDSDVIGQEDQTFSEEKVNQDESTPKTTSVKCSVFGTPIIKSCSPYQTLPNPDNFTKGVSPVIDFENLPNSTGKYEQMTGVLQKVRNTLKGLQKSET